MGCLESVPASMFSVQTLTVVWCARDVQEKGMTVDKEGYQQAMADQKARSRGEGKDGGKQVRAVTAGVMGPCRLRRHFSAHARAPDCTPPVIQCNMLYQ